MHRGLGRPAGRRGPQTVVGPRPAQEFADDLASRPAPTGLERARLYARFAGFGQPAAEDATTKTQLSPKNVLDVLARHPGRRLPRRHGHGRSWGSYLYDARSERMLLDLHQFRDVPVGYNHRRWTTNSARLSDAALTKPTNSDITPRHAEFAGPSRAWRSRHPFSHLFFVEAAPSASRTR